jgi:hypothetical protein
METEMQGTREKSKRQRKARKGKENIGGGDRKRDSQQLRITPKTTSSIFQNASLSPRANLPIDSVAR